MSQRTWSRRWSLDKAPAQDTMVCFSYVTLFPEVLLAEAVAKLYTAKQSMVALASYLWVAKSGF